MIRTAAQVTQAGKLSARFHREVVRRDGREFRFLAMAPIPTRRARNDGAESYRWLTDGRSLLLVRGPAGKPTVVDENTTYATAPEPQPIRGTGTLGGAYPANADTARSDSTGSGRSRRSRIFCPSIHITWLSSWVTTSITRTSGSA